MANRTSFRVAGLGLAAALLLTAAGQPAGAVADIPRPSRKTVVAINALPDPGTLTGYRDRIGQTFYFEVTGTINGSLWGTGVYTDDSALGKAAVHAGLLRDGEKGILKLTMLPGQASYLGTTQNGITSSPYQAWTASYQIERVQGDVRATRASSTSTSTSSKILADPGDLQGYRDKVGQSFLFRVTGTTTGAVWGTGVYTDDSTLATAVVHAGVLGKGQTGVVKVTILAGQNAYQASVANGVTTNNWQQWNGSFSVRAAKAAEIAAAEKQPEKKKLIQRRVIRRQ